MSTRDEAFPFFTPNGMKVAPGCSVEFSYRAQCPFIPDRLVMPYAVGAAFTVSAFQVRPHRPNWEIPDFEPGRSYWGGVAGFTGAWTLRFQKPCPEIPGNIDMVFHARNNSDQPLAFRAELWGLLRVEDHAPLA